MRFMKWGLPMFLLFVLMGCARAEPVLPTDVQLPDANALSATEEAGADVTVQATAGDTSSMEAESNAAEAANETPEGNARSGVQQRGGGDLSTPTQSGGGAPTPIVITPIPVTAVAATPIITVTPLVVTPQTGGDLTIPDNATLLDITSLGSYLDTSGRIVLNVEGRMVNDCRVPFEIQQAIVNTTVYVRIFQVIPDNARCSRNILRFEEAVPLTVPLTRGTIYTVDVNNTRVQLTAQ